MTCYHHTVPIWCTKDEGNARKFPVERLRSKRGLPRQSDKTRLNRAIALLRNGKETPGLAKLLEEELRKVPSEIKGSEIT